MPYLEIKGLPQAAFDAMKSRSYLNDLLAKAMTAVVEAKIQEEHVLVFATPNAVSGDTVLVEIMLWPDYEGTVRTPEMLKALSTSVTNALVAFLKLLNLPDKLHVNTYVYVIEPKPAYYTEGATSE